MKKILLTGILSIGFGFLLGSFMLGEKIEWYQKEIENPYYFLQEGVYTNEDVLKNDLVDITKKIVEYQNNKFYVYVGITKDKEIAEKIKQIYEKKGYKISEQKKELSSEEFKINVDQFDLLLREAKSEEEIMTIEEVVLANYEEIVKNSSK